MNKKDKDSLIIVGFILACVLIACLVYFSSKSINPMYFAALIILAETFIFFPNIAKWYYSVMNSKIGFGRWIPLWNELILFSPKLATATIIFWVLEFIALGFSIIRLDVYEALLGVHLAMNITNTILWVAILIFVVLCIIRGIGLCKMYNKVLQMIADFNNSAPKQTLTTILCSVCLFVPVVRIVGIVMIYNSLFKLEKLNSYRFGKKKNKKRFTED